MDVCCQLLVAESTEGVPIGFLQPPAWFSSASSWSLMLYYNGGMVTPTKVVQYSPREVQQHIRLGYCEIYCCVGSVTRVYIGIGTVIKET